MSDQRYFLGSVALEINRQLTLAVVRQRNELKNSRRYTFYQMLDHLVVNVYICHITGYDIYSHNTLCMELHFSDILR